MMLRTFQRMSSNSVMFLLIIISMVVTKVFGNLHGAVDTLIVETDYGNVSSWEVVSYAKWKVSKYPNPGEIHPTCQYVIASQFNLWKIDWTSCKGERLLQNGDGEKAVPVLWNTICQTPHWKSKVCWSLLPIIFFSRRENLNWFPFDWFTPDFGNQRRFPHGRVFWMGPKCQTLVFRLYPWILCISIDPENSKIPCPVQCPSILRLMIGIKIGEIWVLPWFLWWGDVEPKHSIVRGKA